MKQVNLDFVTDYLTKNNKFNIAFVGDSITSTEWVHPNWREIVEYVLKDKLESAFSKDWRIPSWGIRCFNFGYDGSTSSDIVEKIDDIRTVNPDLVIIMIGINDPTLNVDVKTHVENIKTLIGEFENNALVILTDIYPSGAKNQDTYLPYVNEDIAIDYRNSGFINLFEKFRDFDLDKLFTFKLEDRQTDGLHPNQLGNAYIAKVILKEVFEIEFNPELFWKTTLEGEKYPKY